MCSRSENVSTVIWIWFHTLFSFHGQNNPSPCPSRSIMCVNEALKPGSSLSPVDHPAPTFGLLKNRKGTMKVPPSTCQSPGDKIKDRVLLQQEWMWLHLESPHSLFLRGPILVFCSAAKGCLNRDSQQFPFSRQAKWQGCPVLARYWHFSRTDGKDNENIFLNINKYILKTTLILSFLL